LGVEHVGGDPRQDLLIASFQHFEFNCHTRLLAKASGTPSRRKGTRRDNQSVGEGY
jgi:hypothetical protein